MSSPREAQSQSASLCAAAAPHAYKCLAVSREGRAQVGANFCEEPPPPLLSEKKLPFTGWPPILQHHALKSNPNPPQPPSPSSSHPSPLFLFFTLPLSLSLSFNHTTNFVEVGFAFRKNAQPSRSSLHACKLNLRGTHTWVPLNEEGWGGGCMEGWRVPCSKAP